MNTQSHLAAAENPFVAAEQIVRQTSKELASESCAQLDHGQAEALCAVRGREVVRLLLQGHLDLRAQAAPTPEAVVLGADGVARTHRRVRSTPLLTVAGPVSVTRTAFSARNTDSLAPLDGQLNLPPTGHSDGVRKLVAEEAARGSYDEACLALQRHHGLHLAKRQAEAMVQEVAHDFEDFYQQQQRRPRAAPGEGDLIVLSTDGKGIVMRPDGLREATRAKSERAQLTLRHRLSAGEKHGRKRMAMVAAVYSILPFVRAPADIVRDLAPSEGPRPKRPEPHDKRVWAGIDKDGREIIADAFAEAGRRDPQRTRRWVALVDGNGPQLDAMIAQAGAHEVDLTIVLDVIHVIEYLWAAAWCFHASGDRAAEAWVSARLNQILRGRSHQVAAGIRRAATKRKLAVAQRRGADRCASYLLNNQAFLQYDRYLADGLPIATGVIEGACRHLIKDRMDITGARWGLPGAEAILRLRALRSSGDFDAYWTFHQRQRLQRHHLSRYAQGRLPALVPPPTPARRAPSRHLQLVPPASS